MSRVSFADIDECVNNTVCDSHGFCDNTAGSFRCLCYQGFQAPQDGQGCVGEFSVFILFPPLIVFHVSFPAEMNIITMRRIQAGNFSLWFDFLIIGFETVKIVCALASEGDGDIKREV